MTRRSSCAPEGAPLDIMLASASIDQTIRLWDVRKPKETIKRVLKGHTGPVVSIAFSPDGKTLASASDDDKAQTCASDDHTIVLWDMPTKQENAKLKGHTENVRSVAFSPDGKTLASASNDQTIKLWDVQTKREIATLKGHKRLVNFVAFSPDGKTLASAGDDKTIRLWTVHRSCPLRRLLAR
jgi:uncharacterized protein with WD repeat